jgi:hypothetical protein
LSEDLLKERYGNDFFGLVMNNEISKAAQKLVIISDSGFASEAMPVVRKWGIGNCLQIQIHARGTFDNDSRSYWKFANLECRKINNDATIHDLTMRVLRAIMRQWRDTELLKEPTWIK